MEIAPADRWREGFHFISMQRGALVSGFANISVYFYKLLFDRLLKKFNILVIQAEY